MNIDAAKHALSAYNEARDENDVLKTEIIDLITDLLHYARKEGLDTEEILFIADRHYLIETDEELDE